MTTEVQHRIEGPDDDGRHWYRGWELTQHEAQHGLAWIGHWPYEVDAETSKRICRAGRLTTVHTSQQLQDFEPDGVIRPMRYVDGRHAEGFGFLDTIEQLIDYTELVIERLRAEAWAEYQREPV